MCVLLMSNVIGNVLFVHIKKLICYILMYVAFSIEFLIIYKLFV